MPRRSILDDDGDRTDINLSSMIDCIFILLIFFIVTTVFVEEKGLQVDKPDAAATPSLEEKQNVTVEITAENEILVDHVPTRVSEVTRLVRARLHGEDTPVVIRAHEDSQHGVFVGVWDAARRAGAKTLSFNTVN